MQWNRRLFVIIHQGMITMSQSYWYILRNNGARRKLHDASFQVLFEVITGKEDMKINNLGAYNLKLWKVSQLEINWQNFFPWKFYSTAVKVFFTHRLLSCITLQSCQTIVSTLKCLKYVKYFRFLLWWNMKYLIKIIYKNSGGNVEHY